MMGPVSATNLEKFYLKSVSPQEIVKIEYEDKIERLGHTFEIRNDINKIFKIKKRDYEIKLILFWYFIKF